MPAPVFIAYIDGACRGNPGPAACATAITCDGVVILKAAKYLGVAPWELQRQPIAWQHWALMAMKAEASAKANENG